MLFFKLLYEMSKDAAKTASFLLCKQDKTLKIFYKNRILDRGVCLLLSNVIY